MRGKQLYFFFLLLASSGCHSAGKTEVSVKPVEPAKLDADPELTRCRERLGLVQAEPGLPGAPEFETRRSEILGRARGSAVFWIREPRPSSAAPAGAVSARTPHGRLRALMALHKNDARTLRGLVLREGYLYSNDPAEALALTNLLTLDKLFDEPTVWLDRGSIRYRLERVKLETSGSPRFGYQHTDATNAGRRAELLFGDRVGSEPTEPRAALQRDFAALAEQTGFDRVRVRHVTENAIVADLRFGDVFSPALLESQGATLRLGCLDAAPSLRRAIQAWQAGHQPRARSRHTRGP